ncbi:hypothetical protein [Bacillus sp. V5-8f]|uniref:hypothetical protein n=1 Tax=Bacillus sp. V5-8f TaxID=2053044 RepID=UPI000C78FCE9|nr:hypothetical protein [Bacillus sp. V5-8f]PLT33259.1 hypothetical protein CUU64_14525 [Bacillus sp. V5-8f]
MDHKQSKNDELTSEKTQRPGSEYNLIARKAGDVTGSGGRSEHPDVIDDTGVGPESQTWRDE